MLTGCAALKNTSPASNPRRLLCPRAERSKFASLCSPRGTAPFCQWHTAARCQARQEQDPSLPPARQGCVGRGEHVPHRHQPSPSPAETTGRTGGRQLRLGCSTLHSGHCHLAGPGMDNQPPQNGWRDPPAPLCCQACRIPLPAFFLFPFYPQSRRWILHVPFQGRDDASHQTPRSPTKGRSVLCRPASGPTAASLSEGHGQREFQING